MVQLLAVYTCGRPTVYLTSSNSVAQAETVITADEGVRGGKIIPLKAIVDKALEDCDCVKRVLVASRTGASVPMAHNRDIKLEEVRIYQGHFLCSPMGPVLFHLLGYERRIQHLSG